MSEILIFVDELYEDIELWYPNLRMKEAGLKTVIAAEEASRTYHGKYGYPCTSDVRFDQVRNSSFNALIIPGGYAPDRIRRHKQALEIVKAFDKEKKPIAFICHGGWVPISAKILQGKRVTGFFAIKDDLENAGAQYEDAPLVVDGHLVSSRTPADLPQFCGAILKLLGK